MLTNSEMYAQYLKVMKSWIDENYVEDEFDENEEFFQVQSRQIRWFTVTSALLLLCRLKDK